jgi:hypothetical protein
MFKITLTVAAIALTALAAVKAYWPNVLKG